MNLFAPTLGADSVIEDALFLLIDAGIILISLATVMCLYRIIKGPTLVDRGLASDTVAVQIAGLILLLSIRFETLVTFDAVLIVSILGFVSTLAFAQFIGRRGAAQ
ncbi:MAG: monovalent cation/H+ antiporter complex subunit F [Phycisphaerales bacterium]|nr:monovalent cation/H+ antiporter complex subunit F [bacterium]